ncbi:MAG TPA: polymer-forming cytoskeletal protein, partial [Promineifilum sp.]|nr:polymer-forming cytoskeletal protein [Promineifilum sp.]
VVNNDVVVLDGDLEIRSGAEVNGDIAVFNGDAFIDGRVNGSVTLFNGDLETGRGASISGECVLLNGDVLGDSGPSGCTAIQSLEFGQKWLNELPPMEEFVVPPMPAMPETPAMPEMPAMPEAPAQPRGEIVPSVPAQENGFFNTAARFLGIIGSSLLFGFLGLLTAAILPDQLRQIVNTAREKPVVSGMAGALTAVAVPSLIILLIPLSIVLTFVCIGLLGFPIMFLLGLALVGGGFLGWITIGARLGSRVVGRGKTDHIKRSAALGTALLTFIVGLLSFMPFIFGEALLSFIILCMGLGAVALTQFGMKPYPRRPRAGDSSNDPDAGKVESVLNTLPPEDATA